MALVWKPIAARFWLMLKKVKSSSIKDFTWKFFRLNIFCILLSLNQKVMVESTLNYPDIHKQSWTKHLVQTLKFELYNKKGKIFFPLMHLR